MKKNLIVLGLLIFLGVSLKGQNKFNLEFGIGPNYTSAILKYKHHENSSKAQSYSIHGRIGITTRLGIKYIFLKRMAIKTNVSYDFLNSKYITIIDPTLSNPNEYGTFTSKIRSNIFGASLGVEFFIFNNLSISGFINYSKNFKRRTDLDIHMVLQWDPNYRYNGKILEETVNEKSASIELAYYYKKIGINPGFEYTFTKKSFYPTENTGYRYKIYIIFSYLI